MELFVTAPDFQLLTGDPRSLQILHETSRGLEGELPYIKDGDRVVPYRNICKYLEQLGHSPDPHLGKHEHVDIQAYTALVDDLLYDAFLCNVWLEPKNFAVLSSRCQGIFQFSQRKRLHSRQLEAMARLSKYDGVQAGDFSQIYKETRRCLEILERKLRNGPFFFGQTPSSLDAIIFGHLSFPLFGEFAERSLFEILQPFQALREFCLRMRSRFFPDLLQPAIGEATPKDFSHHGSDDASSAATTGGSEEDRLFRRSRNWALALGTAAVFMYAFSLRGMAFLPERAAGFIELQLARGKRWVGLGESGHSSG